MHSFSMEGKLQSLKLQFWLWFITFFKLNFGRIIRKHCYECIVAHLIHQLPVSSFSYSAYVWSRKLSSPVLSFLPRIKVQSKIKICILGAHKEPKNASANFYLDYEHDSLHENKCMDEIHFTVWFLVEDYHETTHLNRLSYFGWNVLPLSQHWWNYIFLHTQQSIGPSLEQRPDTNDKTAWFTLSTIPCSINKEQWARCS